MDLNENIRIAAEVYDHNIKLNDMKVDKIFIDGAKSQAAKDYWYNEFKREQMAMRDKVSEIPSDLLNQPMKPHEAIHGKSIFERSDYKVWLEKLRNDPEVINPIKEMVKKDVQEYKDYLDYIKEHPDRPISFDNWKYMVEHYQYNSVNKEMVQEIADKILPDGSQAKPWDTKKQKKVSHKRTNKRK